MSGECIIIFTALLTLALNSWTYNFDEDPYGEVDILEYAMLDSANTVSLHTCGACKFDLSGQPGMALCLCPAMQ
jgi:hypothetical protein